MARRFRGKSLHKVDAKGRVSIPASFRRVLEEGDPDWPANDTPQFVIVYGSNEGQCLEGYSLKSIDEIDDLIEELPHFSPEREYLETILGTESEYATVDNSGRMVLSQALKDKIGLDKEAVFVGKGNRFQIWEPSAYEAELARLREWAATQDNPKAVLYRRKSEG